LSVLLSLLANPIFYLGAVLMVWELARNAKSERRLFGVRLTKVATPVLWRWFQGILTGIVLSLLLLLLGAQVVMWEVWTVTALSLLFALVRVRLSAVQYAVGALALAAALVRAVPLTGTGPANRVVELLTSFHLAAWLAIAGLGSIATAVLTVVNRTSGAVPAAILSRRGGALGAYVFQAGLVVPVALAIPGADAAWTGWPLHWPWLAGLPAAFSLVGFPVLAGTSAVVTSGHPRQALRPLVWWQTVLGFVLIGLAYLYRWWPDGTYAVAAVLCLAGLEFLYWYIRRRESSLDPQFIEAQDGVRVLGTARGSLAGELGLQPGEVITHVNQVPVHSKYDLHFAFEQNPAYAKLQVQDMRGEPRFVGTPVYDGERRQLGLVLASETGERLGYAGITIGLFQTVYLRVKGIGTDRPPVDPDAPILRVPTAE